MTTGKIEPQGWGEILPGLGADVVRILQNRDKVPTTVRLDDGSVIDVVSCIWGRDFGEYWEHVYFNMITNSKEPVHFVLTSAITHIVDPVDGNILYTRPPQI